MIDKATSSHRHFALTSQFTHTRSESEDPRAAAPKITPPRPNSFPTGCRAAIWLNRSRGPVDR